MNQRHLGAAASSTFSSHAPSRNSQRGMALVLVLWLVVLLSVLAGAHARNSHNETLLAGRQVSMSRARAIADAGVRATILELLYGTERDWQIDGTIHTFEFGGRELRIAIRDATGLVDLNSADAGLLAALISAAGVDAAARERIVDSILDWRDVDDLRRLHGAEDDDYLAAGFPWMARDDSFASIDELTHVMGVTRDIFDRLSPYLTVYSGRARVNLELASPFLVSALTGKVIDNTAANTGERQVGSGTYHVYVSVVATGGERVSLECVIRISPDQGRPYTILQWREPMRAPFVHLEAQVL